MKKLLLLLFIIPFVGLSALFAATDFNINFENLVMPSDELYVEQVALEPIEVDLESKDKRILDSNESQIIDVLQGRQVSLENFSVPKINETAMRETLDGYRSFREEEIRTQIDNVAEQNDVIGVLYEEVEEFEISLRNDLINYIEVEKSTWVDEYQDLEMDLRNFDDYYKEKIKLVNLENEKDADSLDGESDSIENDAFDKPLYDRRIVDLIISGKEGYLETYESIVKQQEDIIVRLERSIKSEDNSLLAQKYTRTLELIKQDQVNLNNSLEKLLRYKESIISLAEKLEMIDYVLSGGIDREILSGYEEYLRMENKELLAIQERYSAEMRQSLDVYQMEQSEAQRILKYSLEHLNNVNLR